MIESSRELDLALKAIRPEARGKLRVEHLERYRAIVPEIAREVDRGHPAAAKLALEHVAIS